nr:immunoglobulin heavy chain junction region [Mus musculus]
CAKMRGYYYGLMDYW